MAIAWLKDRFVSGDGVANSTIYRCGLTFSLPRLDGVELLVSGLDEKRMSVRVGGWDGFSDQGTVSLLKLVVLA